jgi:hypothetical protein
MKRQRIKPLAVGASVRVLSLAAPVPAIPSEQQIGSEQRAKLYASDRWRTERKIFLKQNLVCATPDAEGTPPSSIIATDISAPTGWRRSGIARDGNRCAPFATTRSQVANLARGGVLMAGGYLNDGVPGACNRSGSSRESRHRH